MKVMSPGEARNKKYQIFCKTLEGLEIYCISEPYSDEKGRIRAALFDIKTLVTSKEIKSIGDYHVELKMEILTIDQATELFAHQLTITYSVMLGVNDGAIDEAAFKRFLFKNLPLEMYDTVSPVISNTMKAAVGYPLKCSKTRFVKSFKTN